MLMNARQNGVTLVESSVDGPRLEAVADIVDERSPAGCSGTDVGGVGIGTE